MVATNTATGLVEYGFRSTWSDSAAVFHAHSGPIRIKSWCQYAKYCHAFTEGRITCVIIDIVVIRAQRKR